MAGFSEGPAVEPSRVSWLNDWVALSRLLARASFALLPLSLVGIACVNDTPVNPIGPPDPNLITVFFPQDGLVYGRGSPGAVPAGTPFVLVRPHPSRGTSSIFPANTDGSFDFAVAAGVPATLEFAISIDDGGKTRGAPSFIDVPQERARREPFFCCAAPGSMLGRCQPVSLTECSTQNFNDQCDPSDTKADPCAKYNGQTISITDDAFTLTQPNANRAVTLRSKVGSIPKLSLVKVENRGHRPFGGSGGGYHSAKVADERGMVEFKFEAAGNDEVVIEILAIDGVNRSRQHALYVPDADLEGLDLTGVVPITPLRSEQMGTIGLRFALSGIDQRGICPPSTAGSNPIIKSDSEDPALCFSAASGAFLGVNGGLDYARVSLRDIEIDGKAVDQYNKTATTAEIPVRKFTDGDVLAEPTMVVIIVDNSVAAAAADPKEVRIAAAVSVAGSLRRRDYAAVMVLGAAGTGKTQWRVVRELTKIGDAGGRAALRDTLLAQVKQGDAIGDPDQFGAIAGAGELISNNIRNTKTKHGKIVLITAATPVNVSSSENALARVLPAPDSDLESYPVFVIATPQSFPNCPMSGECRDGFTCLASLCQPPIDLETIALFSGGAYRQAPSVGGLVTAAQSLEGLISGAFVLLYDMRMPQNLGTEPKLAKLKYHAMVELAGGAQRAEADFEGDIELRANQ